ncbi:VOC family protein [Euzebya sp.]|uniref:VOC family protein n=1 Tax=Euzebya sp. TaxID=1971409 RepID=UPI00351935D4
MSAHPVTWFEVHSADPDRAKSFYRDLFGWSYDDSMPGYSMIDLGDDAPVGGGITGTRDGQPPMAVFLVQVPDVAAVCDRVEAAGGRVAVPDQSTPDGLRFAYLVDPDGSTFGIWTPPGSGGQV